MRQPWQSLTKHLETLMQIYAGKLDPCERTERRLGICYQAFRQNEGRSIDNVDPDTNSQSLDKNLRAVVNGLIMKDSRVSRCRSSSCYCCHNVSMNDELRKICGYLNPRLNSMSLKNFKEGGYTKHACEACDQDEYDWRN